MVSLNLLSNHPLIHFDKLVSVFYTAHSKFSNIAKDHLESYQ